MSAIFTQSVRPFAVMFLIGFCGLVFLYELVISGFVVISGGDSRALTELFFTWGFNSVELTRGEALTGVIETPVPNRVTIFSSLFLHGGIPHFGWNMAFLWVLSVKIEDKLGHWEFLVFYIVARIVAVLSHWVIAPGSDVPLIGATGAIAGVMTAYLLFDPSSRIRVVRFTIPFPVVWWMGIWFAWQVLLGLLDISVDQEVSTPSFSNMGGFAKGLVLVAFYRLKTGQAIWIRGDRLRPLGKEIAVLGFL